MNVDREKRVLPCGKRVSWKESASASDERGYHVPITSLGRSWRKREGRGGGGGGGEIVLCQSQPS